MGKTEPIKNWGWTQSASKGQAVLPLTRHRPCYSYSQYVNDTIIHKQMQITKTWTLLQTTGGKNELNIVFMRMKVKVLVSRVSRKNYRLETCIPSMNHTKNPCSAWRNPRNQYVQKLNSRCTTSILVKENVWGVKDYRCVPFLYHTKNPCLAPRNHRNQCDKKKRKCTTLCPVEGDV